jgi:homoserine kinase type II
MAVYTHLDNRALRQHLRPFRLGDLLEARPVLAGTINTIYEVCTTRGRYILRILENRSSTDAKFEEALLLRLVERGLAVPRMVGAGRRGHVMQIAPRQQLSVFQYLPGRELGAFEVSPAHTAQVGRFLATMHGAAKGLGRRRQNRFDPNHVSRTLGRIRSFGGTVSQCQDMQTLGNELLLHDWDRGWPRGTVHGDMFIDNVRFCAGRLCGVLDFEMAATGPYLYDLAVALCDWGFALDRFEPLRAAALVQGYEQGRPLSQIEHSALYMLCRFAATRFAISRFYDFEVRQRPNAKRLYKDYRHFLSRLLSLQRLGEANFLNCLYGRSTQLRV